MLLWHQLSPGSTSASFLKLKTPINHPLRGCFLIYGGGEVALLLSVLAKQYLSHLLFLVNIEFRWGEDVRTVDI